MLENKEQIDKLFKRLKSPVFRFVIIKTIADAYFAEQIKKRIEKEIPERKSILFSIADKEYRQLMDTIYAFEKGIVLIEDFDTLLENEDLSIGFNQRRDKLAQMDIALVVFVNNDESIRKIMSALPDLWSFRTPVIELDYTVIKNENFDITRLQSIARYNYNIGKETAQENIKVLNQRLEKLETKEENLNLINSTYFRLFNSYHFLGLYKEGLEKIREFEKIVKQYNYKEENPEIYAFFLNNLASFNADLGNYQKALEFTNKAIKIQERIYDKNHPALATSYSDIAGVYDEIKNYPKALEFNNKAIRIREKILDKNHPELANSYNNMTIVYSNLANYQKALEFIIKAIKIQEKNEDKNHPSLATSYYNLASLYCYLKNFPKAKVYNDKSLKIFKKALPITHPHIKIAQELEKRINLAIQFNAYLKKTTKPKK